MLWCSNQSGYLLWFLRLASTCNISVWEQRFFVRVPFADLFTLVHFMRAFKVEFACTSWFAFGDWYALWLDLNSLVEIEIMRCHSQKRHYSHWSDRLSPHLASCLSRLHVADGCCNDCKNYCGCLKECRWYSLDSIRSFSASQVWGLHYNLNPDRAQIHLWQNLGKNSNYQSH